MAVLLLLLLLVVVRAAGCRCVGGTLCGLWVVHRTPLLHA
jgi:hypothetical protein